MDTTLLASLCKELLLSHNRVSFGPMGSFMAENTPATFTRDAHVLLPPSRRISFKSSETWDDELLENLYATNQNISLEEAKRILQEDFAQIRQTLSKERLVTFPEFGSLRSTKEGLLFFVMDKNVSSNPDGFGLVPLSLSPLETPAQIKCKFPPQPGSTLEDEAVLPDTPAMEPLRDDTTPKAIEASDVPKAPDVINAPHSDQPGVSPSPQPAETPAPKQKGRGWLIALLILSILILLLFLVYVFREPLRPILEWLLYSAQERALLH